jgi:hypothetical protein
MKNSEVLTFFNKFLPEANPKFCEDFYKILKEEQIKNNQPWMKDLVLLVDGINADNKSKIKK